MKLHTIKKRTLYACLVAASMILITLPAHAKLRSLSPVKTEQVDGVTQQYFFAICTSKDQKPKLLKNTETNQWCDSTLIDVCAKEKVQIGRRVCSTSYKKRLMASHPDAPRSTSTKIKSNQRKNTSTLNNEALDVQEKLIEIAAKRIELRKRALVLVKERQSN